MKFEVKQEEDIKDIEEVVAWQPKNWRIILKNIQMMRQKRDAVVDSQGCERCSDEERGTKVRKCAVLIVYKHQLLYV